MKIKLVCGVFFVLFYCSVQSSAQDKNLKIILIRHAEKPAIGNNLTCQGFNRASQLPDVLVKRFGIPKYSYVPNLNTGDGTKRARAFQTLIPFAVKYNLDINTSFDVEDASDLAKNVLKQKGLVLICWEHHSIKKIVQSLGVKAHKTDWADQDYGSIYVITYNKGKASLTVEQENLKPAKGCAF